jgi:hypothetical protein
MPGYVIEYNRRTGDRRVYEFTGPHGNRDALNCRLDLEEQHQNDGWEVASLVTDSIQTAMKTHSRYFQGRELLAS